MAPKPKRGKNFTIIYYEGSTQVTPIYQYDDVAYFCRLGMPSDHPYFPSKYTRAAVQFTKPKFLKDVELHTIYVYYTVRHAPRKIERHIRTMKAHGWCFEHGVPDFRGRPRNVV